MVSHLLRAAASAYNVAGHITRAMWFVNAVMSTVASHKILLVEDHYDTARAMARLLNLSGYNVRTASTYRSAIEICDEEQFDLVISDVGLPDGSGYDLMREMLDRACTTKGIA